MIGWPNWPGVKGDDIVYHRGGGMVYHLWG